MLNNTQIPQFDSIDEIQTWIMDSLINYGEETQPRGIKTLELYPIVFTLLNPRKRCITNTERKWSFPLGLGEFCWHVSASDQLNFIEFYIPQWRNFADDDFTIPGSCYGRRVFSKDNGKLSQWERIIELLKEDNHSRRAVLYFNDSSHNFNAYSKDVPCATSLQFIVREGKLHAFTHMRSNDAVWGLPYDIFLFTMLQELLACELNFELGSYSHSVSSIHIYERHFNLARKILQGSYKPFEMPVMTNSSQVGEFLEIESIIRKKAFVPESNLDNYWKNLSLVLGWFSSIKANNEKHTEYIKELNSSYKNLLLNSKTKIQTASAL